MDYRSRPWAAVVVVLALLPGCSGCEGSQENDASGVGGTAGVAGIGGRGGGGGAGSGNKAGAAGTGGVAGGSGGASGTGGHTHKPFPASVTAFGVCSQPACFDVARACDDYLRSGCGAKALMLEGHDPGAGAGDEAYQIAVHSCAVATLVGIDEYRTEEAKTLAPSEIQPWRVRRAAAVAMCTRSASRCGEMQSCFRGVQVLPPPPEALAKAHPALPPPKAPDPPPYWKEPVRPEGIDYRSTPTPWGKPMELMPADSPACASCALQRCPTFAYACFGAADVAADCPGGDCCQSYRTCIRECGGYAPFAPLAKFHECSTVCAESRPNAMQQLANLQHCADVACKGCEQHDGYNAGVN